MVTKTFRATVLFYNSTMKSYDITFESKSESDKLTMVINDIVAVQNAIKDVITERMAYDIVAIKELAI